VDMGRNIFQADSPVAMIKAVRRVVHEGLSPEKAYEFYLKEKRSTGTPEHQSTRAPVGKVTKNGNRL